MLVWKIHRHTGGLEIAPAHVSFAEMIHRHIGGLESWVNDGYNLIAIHRHIGGLERQQKQPRQSL